MKSTISIFGLLAVAFLVASCGESNTEKQNVSEQNATEQPAGHDHQAADEHATGDEHPSGNEHPSSNDHPTSGDHPAATDLALNDGQKWQMDDHTRTILAEMSDSFATVDVAALNTTTLKAAGASLQMRVDQLIKGCTMTGADHDQLHVYLTGLMPAVAELSEKGQVADAKIIQHQLAVYTEYFE